MQSKIRVLCCREIQKSIKESTWRLLSDQIELLGLSSLFSITDSSIVCNNTRSEFVFAGLFRNINKIKSLEGIDICDIEEAETVSEESWQVLLPTIRKQNSEIWLRFNVRYADDPTYLRFVTNTPRDCISVQTSYTDNPYFPDVLKQEMAQDRAFRPHEARNIWDGLPIGSGRKVWPDFSERIHVKDYSWDHVKAHGNVFMGMDPASAYYPACVWVAVFPDPTNVSRLIKWVYSEYPQKSDIGDFFHILRKKLLFPGSLADLGREIYSHDGLGVTVLKRAIDSRFAKGAGAGSYVNDAQGMVTELSKKANGGLRFIMPQETTIDAMRSRITSDLQYNTLIPIDSYNSPSLFVAPWCSNMIQSLNNHRLEEDSEKQNEKYKDYSDALRICYAGMDKHTYKTPVAPAWVVSPDEKLFAGFESATYCGTSNKSTAWMSV
jgi:hypothetical protein